LRHVLKSIAPDVREMITLLNNELTSMTEKNGKTEERNRHLEDKVMVLSEQLSGVYDTLNEFIKSQQASNSGS